MVLLNCSLNEGKKTQGQATSGLVGKRRRTRQKKMGVSVGEESNWNILEQMVTLYWSDFRGKFLILIKHFLLKLV